VALVLAGVAVVLGFSQGCQMIGGVDFGAVHARDEGVDAATSDEGGDAAVPATEAGPGCAPKTCAQLGRQCGVQDDGCKNAIDCGTCQGSATCQDGRCACTPTTCPQLHATCGTQNDGCGNAIACGTCAAGQACTNNACQCSPKKCTDYQAVCGNLPDGCGQLLHCGDCTDVAKPNCTGASANGPYTCSPTPCTPKTCAGLGANCGQVADGCGGTIASCGTCTAPLTCGGAGTANVCGCTPTTCAALGKNCGTVPDGCGGNLNCGSCTAPQTCSGGGTANVCGCTPLTACPAGYQCGVYPDGCGANLNCGACGGVNTCGGGGQPNVCGCTSDGSCSKCCGIGKDNCGLPCNDGSCCTPCFAAGTGIAMADGSTKPIESIAPGDVVRSLEPSTGALVDATVLGVSRHEASPRGVGIVIVNGTLHVTSNHPLNVGGKPVAAEKIALGDPLVFLAPSGGRRAAARATVVESIESAPGDVPTFDLKVTGPGTYFADGVSVFIKP
jgi:hypothetical protein